MSRMQRPIGFVLVGFLMVGIAAVSTAWADHRGPDSPDQGRGPDKVTLCHVAEVVELAEGEVLEVKGQMFEGPGTVTVAHIIKVSSSALEAHLAHGDTQLEGQEAEDPEPGDDCSSFEPAA